MTKSIGPVNWSGIVHIPPSKSDAQRAILAAGLASGRSVLSNVGESDDELQMIQNIQELGALVSKNENGNLQIDGGFKWSERRVLNAGESGLGLRLITPISSLFSEHTEIHGKGTLLKRSQFILEDQLHQLGVRVRSNHGHLPLYLDGSLKGGELNVDGSVSSQFISGLLMALPIVKEASRIRVSNLKSVPYVQMTLNTLEVFGIGIQHKEFDVFEIEGGQHYQPSDYTVEGDWSSASYWLVASAIGHNVCVAGLSTRSLQADKAILGAFQAANCEVMHDEDGIRINGHARQPFSFDCSHSPDLFPALVALAAHCDGTSELYGLGRLQHKESDRGQTLKMEFEKIGVRVDLNSDCMRVTGGIKVPSGKLYSHYDHRIAMALAIAQSKGEAEAVIENPEVVSKSYPQFWQHSDALKV